MTSKPVEIVVELLNEGMNEESIKNQLVDMGLSGREVYRLLKDANKLRKESESKLDKEGAKFIDKIREKTQQAGIKSGEAVRYPSPRLREGVMLDHRLMQQKLQRLKTAITGDVEQQVSTPQQATTQKPSIMEIDKSSEEIEETKNDEGASEIPEEELAEGMLEKAEQNLEKGKAEERGVSEEDEEEMDREKLDEISKELEQIKKRLKMLEDLNVKLVKLLKERE